MDVVILPPALPGELELEAINRQLHTGAITLDLSQMHAGTGAQLRVLLAGLDLVEHSDILGLASVPDVLAEAMSQVFSGGQALPEDHALSVPGDGQEAVNHEAKQTAEQANEQAVPVQAQIGTAGVPAVLKPLSPAQLRRAAHRIPHQPCYPGTGASRAGHAGTGNVPCHCTSGQEAPEPLGGPPNPFDDSATIGVPVAAFPRWMLCPRCRALAALDSGLFQLKADLYRPDKTRYVHVNCPSAGAPPPVVPARFLTACKYGHLDDFPWVYFVHGEVACKARLKLRELGVSGEAADIQVFCETCGKQRRMSDAFGQEGKNSLPGCSGRHPHLRTYDREPCMEQARAILLGASNSWFSIVLSALAVPDAVDRLGQLVSEYWHILEKVTSQQNIELLRHIGQLGSFAGYEDAQIWEKVEAKQRDDDGAGTTAPTSLKVPEWKVLSNPAAAPSARDFKVRTVAAPEGYAHLFKQVVLVERLREVRTLIGFTRIESPGDFSEMEELPEERRAPLSRKRPTWVPAAEVRGEGLFIEFREEALQRWLAGVAQHQHNHTFRDAHIQWRKARRREYPEQGYPGLRYVLLHSFAHALMRQLALECGYTAASIRERIYSLDPEHEQGPMAGILLYTAAPDSEGTLGGLVRLGVPDQLGRHIDGALEQMQYCTSDPLCAEHTCAQDRSLHEAACHACLFLPETSCERGNKYLDRSVLVPTMDRADLAFFET